MKCGWSTLLQFSPGAGVAGDISWKPVPVLLFFKYLQCFPFLLGYQWHHHVRYSNNTDNVITLVNETAILFVVAIRRMHCGSLLHARVCQCLLFYDVGNHHPLSRNLGDYASIWGVLTASFESSFLLSLFHLRHFNTVLMMKTLTLLVLDNT